MDSRRSCTLAVYVRNFFGRNVASVLIRRIDSGTRATFLRSRSFEAM